MNPEVVSEIIDKIKSLWTVSNELEITLEANPSSVEAIKFKDYQLAGTVDYLLEYRL